MNRGKPALAQISGEWAAGSLATNPLQDDVLATTGQLAAGDYFIQAEMKSTADTTLVIAWRNAANDGDNKSYEIPVPADQPVSFVIAIGLKGIAANERFVVRCKANVTGDVQASIFHAEVIT